MAIPLEHIDTNPVSIMLRPERCPESFIMFIQPKTFSPGLHSVDSKNGNAVMIHANVSEIFEFCYQLMKCIADNDSDNNKKGVHVFWQDVEVRSHLNSFKRMLNDAHSPSRANLES